MTPEFLRRDLRIRLLAVIGCVVMLNVLLASSVWRTDLTRGAAYTLSDASVRAVQKLEKPLTVKAYFTRDLQPPYAGFEQAFRDKLEEYMAHAGGRLKLELKDPTGKPELEEEAQRFGVTAAKIDYRARDQREIKTAYMGATFVYGDKQETIPILRNLNGLEYDITRILKSLTASEEKKTIGFVLGHGEPDLLKPPQQGGSNPLRTILEENYKVTSVDLSQSTEIPADVSALVVFAPMQEVSPRHQFELDQFLMAGKPVGYFLPSHLSDPRMSRLNPIEHKLNDLLSHYGVSLTQQLVLDRRQNARSPFPVRQGRMVFQALINYPLHPVATTFDKESIMVRDVEALPMPMQQALRLTDAAKADTSVVAKALISSSEFSRVKPAGQLPPLDPQALMDEAQSEGEEPGPFALAYTLEGPFKSYWAQKPLPNDDSSLDGRAVIQESPKNRLLVVGSAEFLRSGGEVFLNMVDWLAQDEDLISIRSKGESAPPLKVIEPESQRLIALANVVGIPLFFVLFGLVRWRLRKRQQAA
ncbi:MAG: GldG family protein [Myxococcota bacterium]